MSAGVSANEIVGEANTASRAKIKIDFFVIILITFTHNDSLQFTLTNIFIFRPCPDRSFEDVSMQVFIGCPTNACLDSFVFAEFFRKTGKATFANSA
jgi:hypothetical protein